MKETFDINDVAMMTGLSTRTVRTYIANGFLRGDKDGGAWKFTAEQLDEFMQNKAVRPTLRAKKNALVYDFLGTKPNGADRMCAVLDLPADLGNRASVFFCGRISEITPRAELRFASERIGAGVRLILSGSGADVRALLARWNAEAGSDAE